MLLGRGTPCFWMVGEERCEEDTMSKQSCLCVHAVGKSCVFETLWSQIVCLQDSPWSWLSQSDSKVARSALENCKGKTLRAEMGDRVLKMISSIQVQTPQLKVMHTQIPSSGFLDTKRLIKTYYYWLLHDKIGKICEKGKKIWTCISAYYMIRNVVKGMLLNLWLEKTSFVFVTHTGLGCAVPVGVLPCVASLDFCSLILLLSFPPEVFIGLYFSCVPDGKEIGSHTSTQVRMSKSSNEDVLRGPGRLGSFSWFIRAAGST